ncbi:MAG: type II secretion system F family protein [Weeksellaceae bacterium]
MNSALNKFTDVFTLHTTHTERLEFVEKLSMLLSCGMPIVAALESIHTETESEGMKKITAKVLQDIISGTPLWKALDNAHIYTRNTISLIKIGEQSGKLVENLNGVVEHNRKEESFNSKVRTALFYPIFVIILTILIGGGISLFILPRIATVFSSLDVDLPLMTRIMIFVGTFLASYGFIVVPLVALAGFMVIYFLFFFPKTLYLGEMLLLRLPIIKTMVLQNEVARFGYLLGSMLNSGIIITAAIEALEDSTSFTVYKKVYARLRSLIEAGNSFQKSFKQIENVNRYIPISIQQMIVASEQSGSTAKTLVRIGEIYEEKTENSARNLSVALEPTLLLIVGAGVFFVAISIILPIYSLIGNIN